MENTLKERMKKSIRRSRQDIFLRDDFAHLGATYRQLSRALSELQEERVLLRAGYGLYLRPATRDVATGLRQIQERLGGRVRREVTIGDTTVQLGLPKFGSSEQDRQDRRKLAMATAIAKKFAMPHIRRLSLSNMQRWEEKGVWVTAFDEWRELLINGTDQQVLSVLLGADERSNRLRQSAPYTGLLTQAEVEAA